MDLAKGYVYQNLEIELFLESFRVKKNKLYFEKYLLKTESVSKQFIFAINISYRYKKIPNNVLTFHTKWDILSND